MIKKIKVYYTSKEEQEKLDIKTLIEFIELKLWGFHGFYMNNANELAEFLGEKIYIKFIKPRNDIIDRNEKISNNSRGQYKVRED